MATEYTAPTFIVVRLSIRQQAENAAKAADPEAGAGTFVPGLPLRAAGDGTNTVVALIARWNMKPTQRSAFASNMGGPVNLITVDKTPNPNHDKWLFDASEGQWTEPGVLSSLGFDRLDIDDVLGDYTPTPPNWP